MTSSANNRGFSRMGVDPTVSGLVDGTDFPHSALFHALNIATQGNYAIIEGNDFDITQSDSGGKTQFAVAAGKVIRNGVLQAAVSTANFTQGTPSSFEEPTTGFAYYLLVVNSSNALALKDNGGTIITDTVPNPASTDIPIAVLRLGAGETTTQRHVQFLTTTKTSNSLSIARDNSGVYTESATVKSNAGDIEFESLETDKDIIFKVKDGSSVVDRLILYGDNDPSFPNTEVKIEGSLLATEDVQANKLALGYGNSPVTGTAEISAYSSSEPIVFKTGSSAERVRITSAGRVGIGENSPDHTVHITDSSTDFPFRIQTSEGNFRLNKFGHLHIQNENASDSNSFDEPFWSLGQRDDGKLDISFGTPSGSNAFVGSSDAYIRLEDDSGTKKIGFFGTAPDSRTTVANLASQSVNPDAPSNPTAAEHASTQAAITAIVDKLNDLIDALGDTSGVGLIDDS